jgi:hypothetical protein
LELEDLWNRLLEGVSRASPFIRSYLVNARLLSIQKTVFTIGFDSEFEDQMGLVDNARNHSLLQTKLAELGYANAQIRFVKTEVPSPRPAVSPEAAATPAPPKPVSIATARSLPTTPQAPKEKIAPIPFSKDEFKNDPLIQKALEVFKGTIVEVRA